MAEGKTLKDQTWGGETLIGETGYGLAVKRELPELSETTLSGE